MDPGRWTILATNVRGSYRIGYRCPVCTCHFIGYVPHPNGLSIHETHTVRCTVCGAVSDYTFPRPRPAEEPGQP